MSEALGQTAQDARDLEAVGQTVQAMRVTTSDIESEAVRSETATETRGRDAYIRMRSSARQKVQ